MRVRRFNGCVMSSFRSPLSVRYDLNLFLCVVTVEVVSEVLRHKVR